MTAQELRKNAHAFALVVLLARIDFYSDQCHNLKGRVGKINSDTQDDTVSRIHRREKSEKRQATTLQVVWRVMPCVLRNRE